MFILHPRQFNLHTLYTLSTLVTMDQTKQKKESMRLDKWLWAARLFKTRRLAIEAINAGQVTLGGAKTKPSKTISTGDELTIRKGPCRQQLIVGATSTRRMSATAAQGLYTETEQSIAEREKVAGLLRFNATQGSHSQGRPTKRDRRLLQRLRRGD